MAQLVGGSASRSVELDVDYGVGVAITGPADGAEHTGGPVTISGTGQPGANVIAREQGSAEPIGYGQVDEKGVYSVETFALDGQEHVLEVPHNGKGANVTTATVTVNPGAADIAAPTVLTPRSNETVVAPAGGTAHFPNAKVQFAGSGQPGAEIEVYRNNGKLAGTAKVASTGNWIADVDANWQTYPFFEIKQTSGTDVQTTRVENVTIERPAPGESFTVTTLRSHGSVEAPAGNSAAFPNAKVPFAGEGFPGATVEVFRQNGKSAGVTTVGEDGLWSLDADFNWGKYSQIRVVSTLDGDLRTIELKDVTIARESSSKEFTVSSIQSDATVEAPRGLSAEFPNARLTVAGEGIPGTSVSLYRANDHDPAVERHRRGVRGRAGVPRHVARVESAGARPGRRQRPVPERPRDVHRRGHPG